MLLRSITKHVKDQNWFAVALDFFIVVAGILIAFQITNWSEASQAAERETAVLEQLHSEFLETVERSREAKVQNDNYIEGSIEVLRVLRSGAQPTDKDAFLRVLGRAALYEGPPIEPTTLTELISSGGLSQLSSPSLRRALVQYHESIVDLKTGEATVADLVSRPHNGFSHAIYFNPEFQSKGEFFLLDYDWERLPETREQFQTVLFGKLSISNNMEELIARGDKVVTEIEKSRQ